MEHFTFFANISTTKMNQIKNAHSLKFNSFLSYFSRSFFSQFVIANYFFKTENQIKSNQIKFVIANFFFKAENQIKSSSLNMDQNNNLM